MAFVVYALRDGVHDATSVRARRSRSLRVKKKKLVDASGGECAHDDVLGENPGVVCAHERRGHVAFDRGDARNEPRFR